MSMPRDCVWVDPGPNKNDMHFALLEGACCYNSYSRVFFRWDVAK
jgi:hypothetical protein